MTDESANALPEATLRDSAAENASVLASPIPNAVASVVPEVSLRFLPTATVLIASEVAPESLADVTYI